MLDTYVMPCYPMLWFSQNVVNKTREHKQTARESARALLPSQTSKSRTKNLEPKRKQTKISWRRTYAYVKMICTHINKRTRTWSIMITSFFFNRISWYAYSDWRTIIIIISIKFHALGARFYWTYLLKSYWNQFVIIASICQVKICSWFNHSVS